MGSADIVPGVSGGTMALIVGIYTRLIHAIKSVDVNVIKHIFTLRLKDAFASIHWRFLAVLLGGVFSAIIFFTRVVPLQVYMFTHPELIYGLFFGLIVGSIYILFKAIESFGWFHGICVLIGTAIGFWVVTLVPADTPESLWFIFLSGSIAICAMILPGISGSYILLILRKYDFVLEQAAAVGSPGETTGALIILGVFLIGAVVGLALFSRFLSWLLDNWYAPTLAVLIGFLIGSLYIIWPYQERTYEEHVKSTEVVEYESDRVEDLKENPPSENRPTFERLGEVTSENPKEIEIETVSNKLIHSSPFLPYVGRENAGTPSFWNGILGIMAGLLMVGALDYLHFKT